MISNYLFFYLLKSLLKTKQRQIQQKTKKQYFSHLVGWIYIVAKLNIIFYITNSRNKIFLVLFFRTKKICSLKIEL